MIDLYQFSPHFNMVNLSPFCMKVEAFLRIADIPYQVIYEDNPANAPKGKLPYIRDNGIDVDDSELIISYLESKLNFEVDGHLSDHNKAIHQAFIRMLDEHLYWVLMHGRWQHEKNLETLKKAFFNDVPPPFNGIKINKLRKIMQQQLHDQGLGRHSSEQIYQKADKDLAALSNLLGDQQWFGGDYVCKLDFSATAFLAQAMIKELPSPLTKLLKKYPNLILYGARSKKIIFPEDAKKPKRMPGSSVKLED